MNNDYPLNTLNQLRPLLIGFRKANGLTQKDLSERLGVTQQTYSRLEANPASASIERRIASTTASQRKCRQEKW
ncbi:helix-turn-helix transcriptional regulator [Enterobacter asburiae]|uniref:helix-turn-helix transcriptional regulator n=1 Tax=Enterobacter asburiae TaxID=61645 RepID=UPI003530D3AD